jgi:hypothetical protein
MPVDVIKFESDDLPLISRNKKNTWKHLVEEQVTAGKLTGVTCQIYSSKSTEVIEETRFCICGRLIRRHSFNDEPMTGYAKHQTFRANVHTVKAPLSVYGELKNGARVCKYIRTSLIICCFIFSLFAATWVCVIR